MNLPGDTPQKRGRAWEPVFAESVGGTPVKMSGAGFAKLDVRGNQMLWSLKYTEKGSVTMSNALMQEALAAINGPGGIGGAAIPGIAFCIDGQEYVCLRKDDAMELMTSESVSIATRTSKNTVNERKYLSPLQRRSLEEDDQEI